MACLTLLLSLWVGVTVSTAADLQKRIIGGQPCERRYHVQLRAGPALCGGSLINDRWILTAAHCLKPGRTINAVLGVRPGPGQSVEIKSPPKIFTDKDNRSHDLMLLKLSNPSGIKPVALPDCEYHPEKVEIAGYAATTGGPNDERQPGVSPTLHCANIEVVSCEALKNTLQELFQKVYQVKEYQQWFCGQTPGMDICYGDSGGGAVYKDKIYGVVSFLGDPNYVCRKAAAFMDLCNPKYAEWIHTTIN